MSNVVALRAPQAGHQQGAELGGGDASEQPQGREPSATRRKNLPAEAPPRQTQETEFEEFWNIYPRHEAMKDARSAYRSARKLVTAETLLAGARQHAEQYEPEYATLAHKWLRGERWNDEPVKGKGRSANPAGHSPRVDDEVQWRNRLIGYAKNKFWFAEMWGDPPGHPRCYAPAEILAEFGFR